MSAGQTITILRKENYGAVAYYPVCDASHALAEIAGTKTLTPQVLRTIASRLGYTVQITHPEGAKTPVFG
jgi:hypothetical protein